MRRQSALLALLAVLPLTACTPLGTVTASTGSYSNWQIQTGTSITSPVSGAYIIGALQINGSQAQGIFSNDYPCSPAVSTYTGSVSSSGNVTLSAPFGTAQFILPTTPYTITTGTL
jgi:hypothetical protein